jgi:hypothetical protein
MSIQDLFKRYRNYLTCGACGGETGYVHPTMGPICGPCYRDSR